MKTILPPLLLCLALILAAPAARADQKIQFPKESAQVAFALPNDWETKLDENGFIANPAKEDSVIIELVELEASLDDEAAAIKEAKATMADFKNVKYEEPEKGTSNGLAITIINGTGEDEDGKAFLNLVLLAKPGAKHYILMSCISSKAGSDKHGKTIAAIIQSLRAK